MLFVKELSEIFQKKLDLEQTPGFILLPQGRGRVPETEDKHMASMILYYSRAAENYFGGSLRYITKGNTEVVAEKLQALTGADLFKVEQATPYSDSYTACTEEAKRDRQQNARPALTAFPEHLDKYDTVYLLYPNYWGTMPMAMFTLLEAADLSGKTVKPLCTNEGSGMGSSERDIQALCPGARVKAGLAVTGSRVHECDKALKAWLAE